jgi:hypothetical protein
MPTHNDVDRSVTATLEADVVDIVQFSNPHREIEVLRHGDGDDPLFVTFDGTDPSADGRDAYVLPAGLTRMTWSAPNVPAGIT